LGSSNPTFTQGKLPESYCFRFSITKTYLVFLLSCGTLLEK